MHKMKKLIFNSILLSAIAIFTFSGCRKDAVDNDTTAPSDNAQAENTFDEASRSVDDVAMSTVYLDPSSTGTLSASCPVVTIDHPDSTTWPKVVTIDFGAINCIGSGGNARRGQIIATFSGPYRAAGTVISITFNNYYVNDNHVEGIKTITNAGTNSQGQIYWTIVVQNAIITKTDGSYITWNSTRVRTWVSGQNTAGNWLDDAYEITGNASGSNSNGGVYTANITSPLYVAWGCRWIEAGIIDVTPSGKSTRTIDFGMAGNCDNDATVTVNGKIYNIKLRN